MKCGRGLTLSFLLDLSRNSPGDMNAEQRTRYPKVTIRYSWDVGIPKAAMAARGNRKGHLLSVYCVPSCLAPCSEHVTQRDEVWNLRGDFPPPSLSGGSRLRPGTIFLSLLSSHLSKILHANWQGCGGRGSAGDHPGLPTPLP